MKDKEYRRQARDMLGWIFGWYKIGNRYVVPNGFQIHHIDKNCSNNSLDNLVILTVEEHREIHKDESGSNFKEMSRQVLCTETGIIYKSIKDASIQTGICRLGINYACNGKRKSAGGFHWKYVSDEG